MVRIAMLYKYLDVMLIILMWIVVAIIGVKVSILREQKANEIRCVKSIRVLGPIADPSVSIKWLKLVPGTDHIYVPLYAYRRNGVECTTYSYKKCKRESGGSQRRVRDSLAYG